MASSESRKSDISYYSIVAGKFAKRVDKGTEGAVERVSEKTKKTVIEKYYDWVSGVIKKMYIEEFTFEGKKAKNLVVHLEDVGQSEVVQIPAESKYFDSFCAKVGSINLKDPVNIRPYSFQPKNETKKKSGINFYQGPTMNDRTPNEEEKAKYFFTKENPQGRPFPESDNLPEAEYRIFKIREREFYAKYIEGYGMGKGITRTAQSTTPIATTETAPETVDQPFGTSEASDDLPF